MKLLHPAFIGLLSASLSSVVSAAGSWSFEDATLTVSGKGADAEGGVKEKLSPNAPLTAHAITLSSDDTLHIALTALEGKKGKRPRQAFLTLHDPATGLEESFPFSVKDNGKAKVRVTHNDLPFQLATSDQPLRATILLAAATAAAPYHTHAFDLAIARPDGRTASGPPVPPPERYALKPEIHHAFRAEPRSPPQVVSLVFTLAVLAAVPALLGLWVALGANLDHAGPAFGRRPVAHALFVGSVVAMEGVFFLYYTGWNLFQTLPVAGVVGLVAYVSGSRALTEVQDRRLAGER